MKIFQSKYLPTRSGWTTSENWAIEIDGQNYYGAISKGQLEKALVVREIQRVNKTIYDY